MVYTKKYAGKWLAVSSKKEVVSSATSLKALLEKIATRKDREQLEIGPISKHVFAG